MYRTFRESIYLWDLENASHSLKLISHNKNVTAIKKYLSSPLTDNASSTSFSKDSTYFKYFERCSKQMLLDLKNKTIEWE